MLGKMVMSQSPKKKFASGMCAKCYSWIQETWFKLSSTWINAFISSGCIINVWHYQFHEIRSGYKRLKVVGEVLDWSRTGLFANVQQWKQMTRIGIYEGGINETHPSLSFRVAIILITLRSHICLRVKNEDSFTIEKIAFWYEIQYHSSLSYATKTWWRYLWIGNTLIWHISCRK